MAEPTTLQMIVIAIASIIGYGVGMWYKHHQFKSSRRVQQELWDRKFHLAESDRQEAVEAFNQRCSVGICPPTTADRGGRCPPYNYSVRPTQPPVARWAFFLQTPQDTAGGREY